MANQYSKFFTVTLCVSNRGKVLIQFLNTANSEDWHLLDIHGNQLDRAFEGFHTHWTVKKELGEFKFTYGVGFDENKTRRLINEILSIARREVRRLQNAGDLEHPSKRLEPKFYPKRELEGRYKPPLESDWSEVYTNKCRPSLDKD